MRHTNHSLVARVVSASRRSAAERDGSGSASEVLAGDPSAPANHEFPHRGFTVAVRSAQMLGIESPTGCNLQVIAGRAWITAEGRLCDVIADAHANVPIAPGVRVNVSALYSVATVLVTVPSSIPDARFELHSLRGARLLTVVAGPRPLAAAVHRISEWIGAAGRRLQEAMSAAVFR